MPFTNVYTELRRSVQDKPFPKVLRTENLELSNNTQTSSLRSHPSKVKRGFTLIELLVVISIIAILITIIVATFGTTQAKARDSRRKTDLDALKKALELFKSDTKGASKYPSNINTDSLVTPKYIKEIPQDPSLSTVNGGNYFYVPAQANGTSTCSIALDTTTEASTGTCETYSITACLENANDAEAKPKPASGPGSTCPQNAVYIIANP